MATSQDRAPSDLSMAELRAARSAARQRLEFARMQHPRRASAAPADPDLLQARVEELTAELIRRYAEDLALVDTLLDEAYAQRTSTQASHRAGE